MSTTTCIAYQVSGVRYQPPTPASNQRGRRQKQSQAISLAARLSEETESMKRKRKRKRNKNIKEERQPEDHDSMKQNPAIAQKGHSEKLASAPPGWAYRPSRVALGQSVNTLRVSGIRYQVSDIRYQHGNFQSKRN